MMDGNNNSLLPTVFDETDLAINDSACHSQKRHRIEPVERRLPAASIPMENHMWQYQQAMPTQQLPTTLLGMETSGDPNMVNTKQFIPSNFTATADSHHNNPTQQLSSSKLGIQPDSAAVIVPPVAVAQSVNHSGLAVDLEALRSAAGTTVRFRSHQAEKWTEKFEELLDFRLRNGHCLVPNCFKENPPLAEWVKRQRYQYKIRNEGKHSTMSNDRIEALEKLGFVWNSHDAVWEERLKELKAYKEIFHDCNVPSSYAPNPQLAIWVKRQRRQHKFYVEGKSSTMTSHRLNKLNEVGFAWNGRKPKRAYPEEAWIRTKPSSYSLEQDVQLPSGEGSEKPSGQPEMSFDEGLNINDNYKIELEW